MKSLLLGLAASCLVLPALAADMPPVLKAPVASTSNYSWFYFGINGAGAKTSSEFSHSTVLPIAVPGTGNITPTGGMAGITLGAGVWAGSTYLGLEADADYDFTKSNNPCFGIIGLEAECKMKSGFFLTQRLILGATLPGLMNAAQARGLSAPAQWPVPVNVPASFAASTILPYLTGGIAERRTEASISSTLLTPAGRVEEWLIGWTAGGGIKIPVSSGISLDLSYLYVGWNKHFVPAQNAIAVTDFKASNEQLLKLGLQFHL